MVAQSAWWEEERHHLGAPTAYTLEIKGVSSPRCPNVHLNRCLLQKPPVSPRCFERTLGLVLERTLASTQWSGPPDPWISLDPPCVDPWVLRVLIRGMVPWNTIFFYGPGCFHFHLSESKCN